MKQAYIGIGSNVGDSLTTIRKAIDAIEGLPSTANLKVSKFYRTSPVGGVKQRDFINGVLTFRTSLSATELLHHLSTIESSLGKKKVLLNGPRTIDLDILFFGRELHETQELQIPHPRWQERLFVLVPLLDLVDHIEMPSNKIDLRAYLATFTNPHNEMIELLDSTDSLLYQPKHAG